MWMGDGTYRLAGSLVTLIHQLEVAFPDREWQTSGGTGTIGDAAHRAEGSASDHNPWLNNTVRALDVAKTTNGPSCEALFRMVNKMYAARDPRVFPYGYAIFNGRITDWGNPGGYHAQQGDQHLEHCHISVGQSGYNSTAPWPINSLEDDMSAADVAAVNAHTDGKFKGKDGKPWPLENLIFEVVDPRFKKLEDDNAAMKATLAAIAKKVGA